MKISTNKVNFFKFFLITPLLMLTGCNFLNQLEGSCADYKTEYQDVSRNQGVLSQSIETTGDYSMALVLDQTSVNKLFQRVATKSFSHNVVTGVELKMTTPQLILGMKETDLNQSYGSSWLNSFNYDSISRNVFAEVEISAHTVIGKLAGAKALITCPLKTKIEGDKTTVYADLSEAQIAKLKVVDGLQNKTYVDYIVRFASRFFSKQYLKPYKLFSLNAWDIGDSKIKLLAGGAPVIDPENHTLTFGMYTNLLKSNTTSQVKWGKKMPAGAQIGLHIHPMLIQKMIGRMMAIGKVQSDVSIGDSSKDQSNMGVTMLESVPKRPDAQQSKTPDFFDIGFRVWSYEDKLCGYADVAAGLKVSVSQNQFTLGVDKDSFRSLGGSGVGLLASYGLETLASTDFFKKALDVAQTTINFNEIKLADTSQPDQMTEDANLKPASFNLNLDGDGISLYLGF